MTTWRSQVVTKLDIKAVMKFISKNHGNRNIIYTTIFRSHLFEQSRSNHTKISMLEKQWVQLDDDVLVSALFATILIKNLKSQLETQKNKGG